MNTLNPDADKIHAMEETIRGILESELPSIFNFDPIVVEPHTDHDGDLYFHSYIVFDGDNDKLDPAWTMTLSGRLWDLSSELGYPGIPVSSFIPRKEWRQLRKNSR